MRREVPMWLALVIIVVVVLVIAAVFWSRLRQSPQDVGSLPVSPEELTKPRPGGPYGGKGLPPGALQPPTKGQ
ncbi:MAG: hypothetical protein NZ805_12310 [Armatimonadetes bacterium]|nr:hypothetical protein [Armatimonadota bacterium]MDW8027794.1 hypothetical protein [Armatimonadota bacterium]